MVFGKSTFGKKRDQMLHSMARGRLNKVDVIILLW
jgi:hypothetical protein